MSILLMFLLGLLSGLGLVCLLTEEVLELLHLANEDRHDSSY